MIKNSLTIAGSDSGGGAGIQADLKTFSALGNYGLSVITALTAQNTLGVQSVYPVSAPFVVEQLHAVFSDIHIDSVKIGMLANADIIHAVADFLSQHTTIFTVLDTVMIAKGGQPLLQSSAQHSLRTLLLPKVDIITPNLPEAATLLRCDEAKNEQQVYQQGKALLDLGCKAVLIKGGHLSHHSHSTDWLITPQQELALPTPRLTVPHTHGTGCTLSAAIAALYPSIGLIEACRQAKAYVHGALEHSAKLNVGHGIGPTHHFYRWW